jgi:hypothetical protein
MSFIDLRRDGRRILVPIVFLRAEPFDFTEVKAMALLDTGATTSGISAAAATELGLPPRGKKALISARGVDLVERFSFRIGIHTDADDFDEPKLPFVFAETLGFEITPGSTYDALLGMDVISQCDLTLDRYGHCRLSFG